MISIKHILNSLFIGVTIYGAIILNSFKNNDCAEKIKNEKVTNINKTKCQNTLDNIQLTPEQIEVAKYVYAITKNRNFDTHEKIERDIQAIFKTLNTRLYTYKETNSLNELVKVIASFDYIKYDFKVHDTLTYAIAKAVQISYKTPKLLQWEDSSIVIFSDKTWKPNDTVLNKFTIHNKYTSSNFKYWSVKRKIQQPIDVNKLSRNELFLAKVIYSETSTLCTLDEIKLVCKVIMNRIGKKDFGDYRNGKTYAAKNAYEVVKAKNAFECINDSNNSNWNEFTPNLNYESNRSSIFAYYMMRNDEKTIQLPNNNEIVYYHDKGITCPKSWTNKYWKPELVTETNRFKFYKVIPSNG